MDSIKFVVYGKPQGKGRPKFTRAGHAYTPKATREYEDHILTSWKWQSNKKLECEVVRLEMTAYFKPPSSMSKKKRMSMMGSPHTKKPDLDNIIKAVLDSLNGHAFNDDNMVSEIVARKKYDETERVEIELIEIVT